MRRQGSSRPRGSRIIKNRSGIPAVNTELVTDVDLPKYQLSGLYDDTQTCWTGSNVPSRHTHTCKQTLQGLCVRGATCDERIVGTCGCLVLAVARSVSIYRNYYVVPWYIVLTDSESATRVTSEDDMIAKGSCILGQKCSRGDSDKKGRTGRTEYLYK